MKVIYEAFDGKRFDEKKECLAYEEAHRGIVKMWDENGETNAECALVVYLGDEESAGGNQFIGMCEETHATYGGMEKSIGDPVFGWWYWDDCDNTYRYLTNDVRKALINAYHSVDYKTFFENI